MKIARVNDITSIIEKEFPLYLAEDWDNCGLQIGSLDNKVTQAIIALDLDKEVVNEAIKTKTELIITHHPMFMRGIKNIKYNSSQGNLIKRIIENNITVYSAHTNLDAGENGLNQLLATTLGLEDIRILDQGKEDVLFKLVIYVPTSHLNEIRQAINDAGSGNIGEYSDCTFRTLGTGTFKPGQATNPFIGQTGQLEEVEEYRLETVVYKSKLPQVLKAMHDAHPYEEVAYDLYELANTGKIYSLGRIGILPENLALQDLARQVKLKLNLEHLRVVGDLNKNIKKVALVGGSGTSLMHRAISQNADVLITGDVKYHEARDAENLGLAIIDAGHQGTEEIMAEWMAKWLKEICLNNNISIKFMPFRANSCFTFL